jgi:hypothetical protein
MALFRIRSREIKLWRVAVLFICISALLISGLILYVRLNRPRSWQLRAGMTTQEVRAIMGDPEYMYGKGNEEWYYRKNEVIWLNFRDGRLSEADTGKGSDSHPINRSRSNLAPMNGCRR